MKKQPKTANKNRLTNNSMNRTTLPNHRPTSRLFVVLTLLILSVVIQFSPQLASAQEEETASPSATTEKLRERIEKIVEEKKEQIQGVISEFDQKKRGFIGQVIRVSEESVTVKTNKTTEIIPIDETVTLLKDNKDLPIDEVAVDDWLLVMGLIEDDSFQPKRIIVTSKSLRPRTPIVALGNIDSISRSSLTLTPRSETDSFSTSLSSKTRYQDINGEEIDRDDISEDTQAVVIGFEDDDEKSATLVRVLTVIDEE